VSTVAALALLSSPVNLTAAYFMRTEMPRRPRILEPNRVYHIYNRRTDRQLLFPSPRAYKDFLQLIQDGVERFGVRICAYCAIETHWHQAIWIREQGDRTPVVNYLRRLSSSHALRFRFRTGTRGHGHVYQDRYKAKPVTDDSHYLRLIRYIEANPVAARLVERAEQWPWSSFAERINGHRRILVDGPVPLPPDWPTIVNTPSEHDDPDL